jgi:hypothetical protein
VDEEGHPAPKKQKVDISDPMSTFSQTVKTKTTYRPETDFVKWEWYKMRGLTVDGKFDEVTYPQSGDWPKMCKATKLTKRYASPSFSTLVMEEALPIPATSSVAGKTEKDFKNIQKGFGAIAHLNLTAQEAFNTSYNQLVDFVTEHADLDNPDKAGRDTAFFIEYFHFFLA